MYAVIKSGGKQYRVAKGDHVKVEKLAGDVGGAITFGEVLMVGGDKVAVGRPMLDGAQVSGEIVTQDRAKKIVVFKMKRRKRYRRRRGHRQAYTEVRITDISA